MYGCTIWSGKHTNLTKRAGEDRNPVLSSDGKEVFLSERNKGSFNVYSFPLDNPEQVKALTSFSTHPVRFLLGGDGTLCYTYNGEIYTQKQGGKPSKVNVSPTRDDQEIPATLSYTRGASEAVASPDGRRWLFIVRGEVFVTSCGIWYYQTDYAHT